jgi:hypothetical protein
MGKALLRIASVVTGLAMAGGAAAPLVDSIEPASATTTTSAATVASTVSAKTLLSKLTVRRESHGSTYSRAKFGTWLDADDDCRNTRAEVLQAESTLPITVNSACTVKTGRWMSKYDGKRFTAATYLDIDHLVPLKEAWTSGAYAWSAQRRHAYANDTGYGASLIAVSVHANRAKSDQEPTTWLPSTTGYRCTYVRNWIAVKYRWRLSVNVTEKTVLARALAKYCTSLRVGKPGTPNLAALTGERSSSPSPQQPTTTTDPRYSTCTAAEAAGAHTPYRRGTDPEYAWYTDRDGDGLVCE